MPFRQVYKRERTKMEPQDRIVVFLAEFDYQVQQINSYGLDDERVSTLLRKILDPKSAVIKDLNNFRKIIAGYIEY